jgi:hypothetical protein
VIRMVRVMMVMTFSVIWQLPLLVIKTTNNWKTKNILVGITFAKIG